MPVGVISFKRVCASEFPDLKDKSKKWHDVCFVPDGLIEDKGMGFLVLVDEYSSLNMSLK